MGASIGTGVPVRAGHNHVLTGRSWPIVNQKALKYESNEVLLSAKNRI